MTFTRYNAKKSVESMVRKCVSNLGFEISRSTGGLLPPKSVMYRNFENLATAYEQCRNEGDARITPNRTRFELLARLAGTPPSEAYFIIQALSRCKDVPGDVCEFGVAQGETSALIANEIMEYKERRLHLFDSFEGLPMPTDKDKLKDDIFSLGSIEAYAGTMSCPDDMVRNRLAAISFPENRYEIHRGFIEHSIETDTSLPRQVSCAFVDFDFYEPIKIALGFLHTVTPSGAMIIVDDYDWFSTGSKTAVDEFLQEMENTESKYQCFVPNEKYGNFAVLTKL